MVAQDAEFLKGNNTNVVFHRIVVTNNVQLFDATRRNASQSDQALTLLAIMYPEVRPLTIDGVAH